MGFLNTLLGRQEQMKQPLGSNEYASGLESGATQQAMLRRRRESHTGEDYYLTPEEARAIKEANWVAVNSTCVRKTRWVSLVAPRLGFIQRASDRGDCWVVFKTSPKAYQYYDVPLKVFRAFINAPSKGIYLNRVLKPNYARPRGRRGR